MPSRTCTQMELGNFPRLGWADVAPCMATDVRSAIEQVREAQQGAALSLEQCLFLANPEGDDLLGLLLAAYLLRSELYGNIITYVVNRNINFTHLFLV